MTTKHKATTTALTACVGTMLLLASCSSSGGSGGSGTGGSSSTGGASATGGSSSTGGSNGTGTGGSNSAGGSNGTGGVSATGGSNGTGGSSSTGGSTGAGGTNASGGRGGSSATGGTTATGGSSAAGGSSGAAGAAGVDQGGVKLAKPCDSISTSKGYLNLGDMRLINNRWGSDALGCSGSMYKVYVNCDSTLGWDFSRPSCGGSRGDPDFPEVEFGVAPFGTGSSLLTSPSYSSTTLLPIQLKNLNSASVSLTNLSTTFTNPSYYDTNYEFWISKLDPRTNADAQVYAEIIMFLGWEANRNNSSAGGWTCDKSGTVTVGRPDLQPLPPERQLVQRPLAVLQLQHQQRAGQHLQRHRRREGDPELDHAELQRLLDRLLADADRGRDRDRRQHGRLREDPEDLVRDQRHDQDRDLRAVDVRAAREP